VSELTVASTNPKHPDIVGISNVTVAGNWAAVLAAIEMGLGSLLHAFNFPFTGHFLSLNQSFMLARASLQTRGLADTQFLPVTISNVVALLKSLSPAGKKLTPMLAISMQGLLFNLGTLAAGRNLGGLVLGSVLSGLWAFAQPLLIYYVIFGQAIVDIAARLAQELSKLTPISSEDLIFAAIAVVAAKVVVSISVAFAAIFMPTSLTQRYEAMLINAGRPKILRREKLDVALPGDVRQNARLAVKDLFSPLFIVSVIMTIFFFAFVESNYVKLIWTLLRVLTIGFIGFFVIRMLPFERLLAANFVGPFKGLATTARKAVEVLREL
jgi:hypothetical protein